MGKATNFLVSFTRTRVSARQMNQASGPQPLPAPAIREPLPHPYDVRGLTPDPTGEPPSYATLGYSKGLIRYDEEFGDYVYRACEGGCQQKLKFSPAAGWKKLQPCQACGRNTFWRMVPALAAMVVSGLLVGCGVRVRVNSQPTPAMSVSNNLSETELAQAVEFARQMQNADVTNVTFGTIAYPTNVFMEPEFQLSSGKLLEVVADTNTPAFYFDTSLPNKPTLFECRNNGELVVRIKSNANVEFGEGIAPDEAAMVFWNIVSRLARHQGL